jgi:hypothetical protein
VKVWRIHRSFPAATSLSHLDVHNPIPKWHGLISGVVFPYSPPEIDRGPVYEFHLKAARKAGCPNSLLARNIQGISFDRSPAAHTTAENS